MNLPVPESRGKKLCRLGVLASTEKDDIDQKKPKQNAPEKEISESSTEINLNGSPVIEIEDPELRDLIESENFILEDYIVVNNDSSQEVNTEQFGDVGLQVDAVENFGLECVEAGVTQLFTHVAEEETSQLEGKENNVNISNEIHQGIVGSEGLTTFGGFENDNSEEVDDVEPHENQTDGKEAELNLQGRPRKGRKLKFEGQTREIKKRRVNLNEDYITTKGEVKYAKEFRDYQCNCKLMCNQKLSREQRQVLFNNFHKAGCYEARCLLLQTMVKEMPIKRKRVKDSVKKSVSREYYLLDQKVCKNIFMQTLRVSSCVIDKALKKKKSGSVDDERGKAGGHNRLPDSKIREVIQHISKFPRYKSHYCRTSTKAEFLNPDTTLPVMFRLYSEEHENPVSYSLYKKIFLTKFNLKCKKLKKDTCNVCDTFEIKKKNCETDESKTIIEESHEKHLEQAEDARKLMEEHFSKAKEDSEKECISFDLEKTLPLPRIPTNIVFYKRQLWFYNLGVHDSGNTGYCYTWVEGQAGRGAQEVGSCLRKHVLENIKEGTTHLTLWSDSCGGQNRNIKVVLILKSILEDHPTLQDITQHYLVPGHSFLRNDSDFSDIESCLKVQQRVYVPDDYIKVIETCRRKNKLKVFKMNAEDFVSTSNLEKSITNRKKDINGEQINWLTFKVIQVRKSHPLSIFVKSDLKQVDFIEVNIGKREPQVKENTTKKAQKNTPKRPSSKRSVKKSLPSPVEVVGPSATASDVGSPSSSSVHSPKDNFFSAKLMPLWPQGKPISNEKLADLKSMWHLIPKDCLQFYKKLTASESVSDDIEGFSGELDFVLEDVQQV